MTANMPWTQEKGIKMTFEKKPACTKPYIGCLNCGGGEMTKTINGITASMYTRIYNGFGGWTITRDGKMIYQGPADFDFHEYPTLMKFENMARKDPDHDWRAECFLPLRGATYQRQGVNSWVLIESNQGFA